MRRWRGGPAERYLELGRLDDGVVDAYFGPPALAAAVEAEALAEPGALVTDADGLLDELLPGDGSSASRLQRWRDANLVPTDLVEPTILVRRRGLLEETIVLEPTPQSLLSEGMAEIAPDMLLYGEGASEGEVRAYLVRWGLLPPAYVDHLIHFITEPTSRTYVMNYRPDGISAVRTSMVIRTASAIC